VALKLLKELSSIVILLVSLIAHIRYLV